MRKLRPQEGLVRVTGMPATRQVKVVAVVAEWAAMAPQAAGGALPLARVAAALAVKVCRDSEPVEFCKDPNLQRIRS